MSNTEVISTSFEPGAAVKDGTIPLCVPEFGGNEWLYVKECLDSNWVSSAGPFVNRFEQSLAEYVGAKHAVAAVNGTAAIHIALLVAGLQPDEGVWVPALLLSLRQTRSDTPARGRSSSISSRITGNSIRRKSSISSRSNVSGLTPSL